MSLSLDSHDLPREEVRRRFRWARRRGEPAWLWPEVSKTAWREAQGLIADTIADVLAGRPARAPLHGDPAAIGLAGYISGVGPLLGWWRERGLLEASPEAAAVLDLHLRHNRIRSQRLRRAAVAVVEALTAGGLEVVVLKGAHTSKSYFPDPAVRPASDVDVLVRAADAAAAEATLAEAGFVLGARGACETTWRPAGEAPAPRSLRLVHADDPWSIDLHASLDVSPGAGGPALLDRLAPMDSRSRWPVCSAARTLDQPLLTLHLAAHAGAGLHSLTLLRLVELCLVIRKDTASSVLGWHDLLAQGERARALGLAYPAFRMCEALAPGTIPAPVLARCAASAPAEVVRLVAGLTPASAQRVDRASVAEHFMWAKTGPERLRLLASDLVGGADDWTTFRSVYEARAWRLVWGRFSR